MENYNETFAREYLEETTENGDFSILMNLCMYYYSKDFMRQIVEGNEEYKQKIQNYIIQAYLVFKEDYTGSPMLFGCTNVILMQNLITYLDTISMQIRDLKQYKPYIEKRLDWLKKNTQQSYPSLLYLFEE